MVVAGTLAAGLLALLLERSRHVRRPMLPAVVGALALTGNAVSGRVTFGLGLLFGLAALVAVFAWPTDRRAADRACRGCASRPSCVLTALDHGRECGGRPVPRAGRRGACG